MNRRKRTVVNRDPTLCVCVYIYVLYICNIYIYIYIYIKLYLARVDVTVCYLPTKAITAWYLPTIATAIARRQTTLHAHTQDFSPYQVAFLGVTSVVPGATDSAYRHFTLTHNASRNGGVQDADGGGAVCVLQIN